MPADVGRDRDFHSFYRAYSDRVKKDGKNDQQDQVGLL